MRLNYVAKRFRSGIVYRLYRWLHPDVPWYTPGAVTYIEQVLKGQDARVFEWGSGSGPVFDDQMALFSIVKVPAE